jgi:hypothetical protein
MAVRGEIPPKFVFGFFCVRFLAVFRHMVFADGFVISVKELGLLTNIGQWIRDFGCRRILYIYCILKNEYMMNKILEVWL